MRGSASLFAAAALMLCAVATEAQENCSRDSGPQPTDIAGAATYIYKSIGDVDLRLHVFKPARPAGAGKPAAIVFFFGGGWAWGSVEQFAPQSRHLAHRGMVAIVADYRVRCRHQTEIAQSTADGISALRWVRGHADELGIDPARIAAAGASAGGHLAVATALFEKNAGEKNERGTARPDALVLFNPALDLSTLGMPKLPRDISPLQHVAPGLPPTIIFNGRLDSTTPLAAAEAYCGAAAALGSVCRVVGYDGADHGFFNPRHENGKWFRSTLLEADRFLTALGYLPAPAPDEIAP